MDNKHKNGLNRRDFIKTTGVVFSSAAIFSPISFSCTASPYKSGTGTKAGYPRVQLFRQESPQILEEFGAITDMVVSDHLVWTRKYAMNEFAKKYPDKPVLIHSGGLFLNANAFVPRQWMEDRELLNGTISKEYLSSVRQSPEILNEDFLPMPDFPGYWLYDAGLDTESSIAEGQLTSCKVSDPSRFAPRKAVPPSSARELKKATGSETFNRIVVLCPRSRNNELEWSRAEFAEVTSINAGTKTLSLRRFSVTGATFKELPKGTYIASPSPINERGVANFRGIPKEHPLSLPVVQFMQPNFTPFCPVDHKTGLNAAQWFAWHFISRLKKYFPNCHGYALDVCSDTHFSKSFVIENADVNNDGVIDKCYVNGISWWGLGMADFVYYMRTGVPGKFAGLGDNLYITWDAIDTLDQRLFHLLNGAEFEHTMTHGHGWSSVETRYSSSIDRLLLWDARSLEPRMTHVSNKFPDEAYHGGTIEELKAAWDKKPCFSLAHFRLDLCSSCMGSGFIHSNSGRGPSNLISYPGKEELKDKYGTAQPFQDYDEYHQGSDNVRNWLGLPLSAAKRYQTHLGKPLYRFSGGLPKITAKSGEWQAKAGVNGTNGLILDVQKTGLYVGHDERFNLMAMLPLAGVRFKENKDYTLRMKIKGSSPYGKVADRYKPIPRVVMFRLSVNGKLMGEKVAGMTYAPSNAHKIDGYLQEIMAFEDERVLELTLISPASGDGVLQIDLSEVPGIIEMRDIEIYRGCADVLYRPFENGMAVLNGSFSESITIDWNSIAPDLKMTRLSGKQAPDHNNGKPVGKTLEIPRSDAFLLKRDMPETAWREAVKKLM